MQPQAPAVESKSDAPANGESADVWKNRYASLQGKYNAEVPQLHSQLRAQAEQLQTVLAQVQELRNAKPTEPAKPLVTTEDETAFGPDLVDLIRRGARAEVQSAVSELLPQLDARIAEISRQLGTVTERQVSTAEQQFWTDFAKLVPDWQQLNADQRFLDWLQTADPILNVPYQAALNKAQADLNPRQAAAIFNAFKLAHGIATTQQSAPQQAAPGNTETAQADPIREELESLVSPVTHSAKAVPAAQAAATKRIWTGQEYAQAYDPRLRHSRTPEELKNLQAEADLAVAENRVRW